MPFKNLRFDALFSQIAAILQNHKDLDHLSSCHVN